VEEDDERMSAAKENLKLPTADANAIALQEAVEFIWREADLLDAQDYVSWLALWSDGGHYILPIERGREDFAAHLNLIYDDRSMREARVKRLQSGMSMSASPSARTVRTVSRFRALADAGNACAIRCAQHLVEYKYDRTRVLAADVTYHLVRRNQDLALAQKVVQLINSDEALFGIGYLL
jgi:3-phenylpropionate/cinnamic acid dioxygenase small subunit